MVSDHLAVWVTDPAAGTSALAVIAIVAITAGVGGASWRSRRISR